MKMFLHFEKEVEGANVNVVNSNPYLVAYNWITQFSRKILILRRGFYKIPNKNDSLSKVTSCLTLTGCHFGQS